MRLFLIRWNNANKDFVEAALELQKRGHEIVYWAGLDKRSFEANKKQFSQAVFHHYRDADYGVPAEEFEEMDFPPPGEDLIKQFYETESIVLTMMRRFHNLKLSIIEIRHYYYRYLQYWHGVIQKFKPEVIVFALCPHAGSDFVLYSLAKFFKIKTIMFFSTRIGDRLFLANDYTIGSVALKEEIKRNQNKQIKLEDLSPDTQKVYKQQASDSVGAMPPDFKKIIEDHTGINLFLIKFKILFISLLDLSIFRKLFIYISKKFKSNLRKEYTGLQSQPDFNKKFLYTALQFQPESSTSPIGGIFIDQLLAIKILSASVPADWLIYVKEHPNQWLPWGPSFFAYRFEGYYKKIVELKNVRLIPVETDSFELISKAQAVATITGTVAWEAVLRSKPALIFGYPWYRDCPGVFRVDSVESCQKAIEKISSGLSITKQDVINYLASLDKVSFPGYFEDCLKNPNKTGADYTKSILDALIPEIEKD